MLLILKLMLIILLNETSAYITQNNTETVILPVWNPTGTKELSLTLKVFDKQIQLKLRRNDQTVSSVFKVWKHDTKGKIEELSQLNASDSCYYHHEDHISSAVINFCQEYGWEGLVFLEDDILEIRPLGDDFASLTLTDDSCVKEETNISFGKSHLIKRSLQLFVDSSFYNLDIFKRKRRHVQDTQKNLTIELAVFFDEAAYRTFMPFLNEDKEKLRNMILAYVNNIQALFHHPSLGASIDISLVYLEIMDKQPLNLPVSDPHGEKLIDLFCEYAHNPPNDNDSGHWDVALYLTGLNIYTNLTKNLKKNILAIARHDSVCDKSCSCAVVEFGVDREITSGFSSSFTAAHEIGHVLGMRHDSEPCKENDYIMSSQQRYQGQVTWSECSRDIAEKLWNRKQCLRDRTTPENVDYAYDHSYYDDLPGRKWNAKAQCEIYFRDKDANVVSLLDICKTLECETPNQNGSRFAGPPLEGTYCDLYTPIDSYRFEHKKECRGGECVSITQPPYNIRPSERDNWSKWKADSCKSSCLEYSVGIEVKRRFCTHETKRTANCQGPYYDVVLCDDSLFCANISRQKVSYFAEKKCTIFNVLTNRSDVPFEELKQLGEQAPHDVEKPWSACTIYCSQNNMSRYYPLRLKMLNIGFDPYFPDGTWCHSEDGQDYFCRQHYCLPESYS